MSTSVPTTDPTAGYHFLLDGAERLGHAYDAEADILYTWRGDDPQEAISISTVDGHLLRLDPESFDLVGVTIFDWYRMWRVRGRITLRTPTIDEEGHSRAEQRDHSFEPVPA